MKATHSGTCQICGSFQLLPDGRLSKHGYTVRWGFFSGVCSGAHRLPFEQSTDAIAAAIANVEKQIAATEAEIASYEDLNNPANDGTQVWIRVFSDTYRWTKATIALVEHSNPGSDYKWTTCQYTTIREFRSRRGGLAPLTGEVNAYGEGSKFSSIAEWARFANRKYAAHLAQTNAQRRQWLAWQAERVAKWAPAPLTPRCEKGGAK